MTVRELPMKSSYFRYHASSRVFRVARSSGLEDEFLARLEEQLPRLGEEPLFIGLVGARAEPIYVPNVQADPRWTVENSSIRSAYFTPICANTDLLGVLGLYATETDGFTSSHRVLADSHARDVAQRWSLRGHAQKCADENDGSHCAVCASLHDADADQLEDRPRNGAGRSRDTADLTQLSERERDVVLALCRGLRLSEIARVLGISHHTARNHLKRVFKKLHVHSQVELLVVLGQGKPRLAEPELV